MGACFTSEQLRKFSECLGFIYDQPTGENPLEAVLDVIERLVRIDSISVDEVKGDGKRVLRNRHLTDRRPELMESGPDVIPHIARDHPIIQHVLRHGVSASLRLSDLVSQRELHTLSLYELNNRRHEWRDQTVVMASVGGGALSIASNRDRVFTDEEFMLLQLLQPHVQRILARCAFFIRLPGTEQLTAREREVLYWMTQGKRDSEIGCIVGCAERTVLQHTRAILRKLGVENRASAISAVLSGRAHETAGLPQAATSHRRRG